MKTVGLAPRLGLLSLRTLPYGFANTEYFESYAETFKFFAYVAPLASIPFFFFQAEITPNL